MKVFGWMNTIDGAFTGGDDPPALEGNWVRATNTDGVIAPITDGELLQLAITARIVVLKTEVELYIDASIQPITRDMLRDGVLDDETADDVRAFIALCYTEANSVIDAIEAVGTIGEVDDPAPVWPIFGGA